MYVTVLLGSIQVNACGACHSCGLCTGGGNPCTFIAGGFILAQPGYLGGQVYFQTADTFQTAQ